jgi:hypothetical protein
MSPLAGPGRTQRQVLALLDDAAAGDAVLELSSALAHAQQRELVVVYIESAPSIGAAALPFTRVLSQASAQWLPFSPDDVERGFRAQAARLRVMAERIALRRSVGWSLRVMRGTLASAATSVRDESDLVLLAGASTLQPPSPPGARKPVRRPLVTVAATGDAAGAHAVDVATELARALGGAVQTLRLDAPPSLARDPQALAALARSDLLVLARPALGPGMFAGLRCPVLLVG